MKHVLSLLSVTLLLSMLSACGDKSSTTSAAADRGGYCSSDFVFGYNNMRADAIAIRSITNTGTPTPTEMNLYRQLDTDCTEFFKNFGSSSCMANMTNTETGVTSALTQVDTGPMKSACDSIHTALSGHSKKFEFNADLLPIDSIE